MRESDFISYNGRTQFAPTSEIIVLALVLYETKECHQIRRDELNVF